ncbi:GmrSD restriction endonuclease domain-containing protein [Nocardia sp. alder85J]|uniref:GmrSD restriction endonuclease domain-containing protein n=1 Tax=Nocardia sp. alder85J TaxID=2862949 RepID=UPI001CD46958|nr:DUF262 domain-containing protein [Nocardia sp. alder85J]MCX4095312.1 DUF262 domain-containing protein [Nocardia sp. alder85J]
MVAAQETSLQKILEGTAQYFVPLYQRPFAWGTDQFRELWQDIVQLAEDRRSEPEATHFLGSVVLAPVPGSVAGAISRFLVVDGQQRMTTVTLLLAAIRDHLREHDGSARRDVDRIQNQLLTNQYEDDPYRLKLLPTQTDRAAYTAVIDRSRPIGDEDRVSVAHGFFRDQLLGLDAEGPTVAQIYQAITIGLSVVSISTHAGDNVHRIFQSLNNTGMKLTAGDLVRNYLFMRLPTRSDEVYRTHWKPLQDALDQNQRLETLLWLDLLHTRPKVKQSDTFAGQQARLEKLRTEDEVVAEVERIARLGHLYRIMWEPSEEADPVVRERLSRLLEWDSTTPDPLVLHLLVLRDRGEATSEQVARALLYIESLMVRRFLVGRLPQGLNRLFAAAVQELDSSLPVDEALHRHLSAGRKHYASDRELAEAIASEPYYLNGRAAQRKTMLLWIERLFGAKEKVAPETLTIEHIMPQKLSPTWRAELDPLVGGSDIDTVHARLVHTLGNLTLTGYNSDLGNHEFESKRKQLGASSIRMNQGIADRPVWGPEEIETRARQLAARIAAAWPGPLEDGNGSENPLWVALNRLLELVPAGRWTTYGDVATVIGTAAQPLGMRLASVPTPNAHRVLSVQGAISPTFRWSEPGRTDDPREVLEGEGIQFNSAGRAEPAQRLTLDDLGRLRAEADGEVVAVADV